MFFSYFIMLIQHKILEMIDQHFTLRQNNIPPSI